MKHCQRFLSALFALTLFTLFRAQGASWWALALCVAAASWTHRSQSNAWFERLARPSTRSVAVLALFILSTVRAFQTRDLITPGVDLLLVLCAERSFFRQRLREQIQLLLVCTILMAIAGVIHVGIDYPFLLAGFVLFAIGHLAFWNLQRQAEHVGARARYALYTDSNRLYRNILAQNLRFGLGVLSCAFLVFLFFPRIGTGVFFRGERNKLAQSGFSDEMALGHRGNISNNPTIVARVYPDTLPARPSLDLYFRVSSFDEYKGGRWSHSSRAMNSRLLRSSHRYYPVQPLEPHRTPSYVRKRPSGQAEFAPIAGWSGSEKLLSLRFVQENLGTQHLILPHSTGVVEWLPRGALERRARLLGGQDGQVKVSGPVSGSMQFRVFARAIAPSPSELAALGRPQYSSELAAYLSVPSALNPTLVAFAREATSGLPLGSRSQYQLVNALVQALREFRYSTQSTIDPKKLAGKDPVEYFLTKSRKGHCEYFASALALLLRSEGIPARVVNGYYGAHQNPVDGTYQIAQSQAHSWVEVYFDGLGWILFDATPIAKRPQSPLEASAFARLRSLYQALETKYLEYIVDYDGKKQWGALKIIGQVTHQPPKKASTILIVALLLFLGLFVWWRKKPPRSSASLRIRRAQEGIATTLQNGGFKIEAQENAISWATRARFAGYDPEKTLVDTITRSEALRFAAREPSPQELQGILYALSKLNQELKGLGLGVTTEATKQQQPEEGQSP